MVAGLMNLIQSLLSETNKYGEQTGSTSGFVPRDDDMVGLLQKKIILAPQLLGSRAYVLR
jgi:hypothetical protein